jgi:hypothetical protein
VEIRNSALIAERNWNKRDEITVEILAVVISYVADNGKKNQEVKI